MFHSLTAHPFTPSLLPSRQEHISKYFPPDIQKIATKCWEQIHPNISSAIEVSVRQQTDSSTVWSTASIVGEVQPRPGGMACH